MDAVEGTILGVYERKLNKLTREELVLKVQHQRTEIRNLLLCAKVSVQRRTEQGLVIRSAISLLKVEYQHTAAYSVLTRTCVDGGALLREMAGGDHE